MKTIVTLFASVWICFAHSVSYAQVAPGALTYQEQAFMFSNYSYRGTARIQGLGGTQISLGGDISLALSNPAGLGFYNRSAFSITPSYNIGNVDAAYLGTNTSTSTGNFNVDNFGIVFNKTKDDYVPGNYRGGSFAITFAKVNKFNNQIQYQGSNPNNDILDFYVQDANNQNVDPFELGGVTRGAYESFLISEFLDAFVNGNDTTFFPFYERTFFSEFPSEQFPTNQSEVITSSGSQNQWNFSYGGNFGDVFYFGATLGIQSIRYEITKEYREQYPNLENDITNQSLLTENLLTEGIGVNGTFGVIGRPIQQMTIGFSLITPTYFAMSERYTFNSFAQFNNFDMRNYGQYFDANYDLIVNENAEFTTFFESEAVLNEETFFADESIFEYNLSTPLRLNGGLTFFINKNGFISADIEYLDYSNMNVSGQGASLEEDNNAISALYKSVVNYRIGGEWRVKKFRVRAGYQYRPNPYNIDQLDLTTQSISAGLGYRSSKFFADLAGTSTSFKTRYSPYLLDNSGNDPIFQSPNVNIENSDINIVLTLGLFF